MSGEGHKDWIADCDFHPKGSHLATASGDCTVKLWDFAKGTATLTLTDHTQGVWGCAFHDTGDFLASCSMDHTAKLWDITVYVFSLILFMIAENASNHSEDMQIL